MGLLSAGNSVQLCLFCAIKPGILSLKKTLSERDICTKYITPALVKAVWDIESQIIDKCFFNKGKIFFRSKLTARGKESNPIPLPLISKHNMY